MWVGYSLVWFEQGSDVDWVMLQVVCDVGVELVEILFLDLFYDVLFVVVEVELVVVFEELMLMDQDDDLWWQVLWVWFNIWCQVCFILVIDLINVDCFCCQVMCEMYIVFEGLDVMIGLNFVGVMLMIINYIGYL